MRRNGENTVLVLKLTSFLILMAHLNKATSRRYGYYERDSSLSSSLHDDGGVDTHPGGSRLTRSVFSSKNLWTPCTSGDHNLAQGIRSSVCEEKTILCDHRRCKTGWEYKCCPVSPLHKTAMLADSSVNDLDLGGTMFENHYFK